MNQTLMMGPCLARQTTSLIWKYHTPFLISNMKNNMRGRHKVGVCQVRYVLSILSNFIIKSVSRCVILIPLRARLF